MSHSHSEYWPTRRGVLSKSAARSSANTRHSSISPVFWAASLFLAICGGLGCGVGRPNLAHPGDVQTQRFNAVAHDPYTDTDAGPEVVGGRPRDFQKNLAEPVRNRWLMDSWWSRR